LNTARPKCAGGNEEEMEYRVGPKELQERIHLVSLMLRRKSTLFIINYVARVWHLGRGQAYSYMREARAEWEVYFNNLKANGKAYHVTQLRDLKDQAFSAKRIIGKGENRKVIRTPNLPLVLSIVQEEAKLMGVYPVERHEVNLTNSFAQWVKEVKEKKELSKEDFKAQNRITGKVLEGVIVKDAEIEEFKDEDKIIEEVHAESEKEEEQMDLS